MKTMSKSSVLFYFLELMSHEYFKF